MRNVIERVLNLLAFLLTVNRPVTAERIRNTVAGYAQESDEAFRRMFERDKDLLRKLGIPLTTREIPFDDTVGYVVDPDDYAIPDPDLTDDERAALWLAAQIVRIGGQQSGSEAILKLGGIRGTTAAEPLHADLGGDDTTLPVLYQAITTRTRLAFEYRDKERIVEPYGVGHRRGHWYLVGVEGDVPRLYRVDRMGEPGLSGDPDAFVRDPAIAVRTILDTQPWETGTAEPSEVIVLVDPAMAWWAVKRVGTGDVAEHRDDGSVVLRLTTSNVDALIGWVLTFGPDAEILGPPEVREALIARVEAAL